LTPRIKNVKKCVFYEKNKKRKKALNKKTLVDKLTTSWKPNEKNSPVKLLS